MVGLHEVPLKNSMNMVVGQQRFNLNCGFIVKAATHLHSSIQRYWIIILFWISYFLPPQHVNEEFLCRIFYRVLYTHVGLRWILELAKCSRTSHILNWSRPLLKVLVFHSNGNLSTEQFTGFLLNHIKDPQ